MSKLGDDLERLEVPMRSEAIARTEELARATVASPHRATRRTFPTLRFAIAGAVAVLVLTVSPPGRSAVSWAADLVGIGGEPTKESPLAPTALEAVIGSGTTPNGTRYEVVASTDAPSVGPTTQRVTCVRVDLLGVKEIRSLTCLTNELEAALGEKHVFPRAVLASEFLGEHGLMIQGPATSEVARVEVVHEAAGGETTTYPAELLRLEPPVSDEIEARAPLDYILGFIPSSLVPPRTESTPTIPLPGERVPSPSAADPPIPLQPDPSVQNALKRISVIAYDAAGKEVGRESVGGPNAELSLYPPLYKANSAAAGPEEH